MFLRNNEKRLVRFQLIKKKINKVSKTADQCDCSPLLAKYLNVLYTRKWTTFPFKTILYFPSNKVTLVYKLTSITPHIYQSLDQGYEVRGVSLDISINFYSNLTQLYQQSFSEIPLLFLVYINDLSDGFRSYPKLLSDDAFPSLKFTMLMKLKTN